ncbi:hypothetical protein [Methylocaldum sp.]
MVIDATPSFVLSVATALPHNQAGYVAKLEASVFAAPAVVIDILQQGNFR